MSAVPRVTLRVPGEAAEAMGVSVEYFNEHVKPHLRLIRAGSLVHVAVRELERYADEHAATTLNG
jgi:hypothetical protein